MSTDLVYGYVHPRPPRTLQDESNRDIPDGNGFESGLPQEGGRIDDTAAQLAYIVSAARPGRRLRFTLKSHTGRHLTFQVQTMGGPVAVGQGRRRYVSVLTGPDNESAYTYLGTIFDQQPQCSALQHPLLWSYYHGKKSAIGFDAVSAKSFRWLWNRLLSGRGIGALAEFWHEGACGRCGRALTDPESIAAGQGPVCRKKGAS